MSTYVRTCANEYQQGTKVHNSNVSPSYPHQKINCIQFYPLLPVDNSDNKNLYFSTLSELLSLVNNFFSTGLFPFIANGNKWFFSPKMPAIIYKFFSFDII